MERERKNFYFRRTLTEKMPLETDCLHGVSDCIKN